MRRPEIGARPLTQGRFHSYCLGRLPNEVSGAPTAWEESSGESLLQIQLLTTLTNFVAALGYQSPNCYDLLMPILQSVLNANSPNELLEDSMQLWEVTLSHATSMTPHLLGYFPCLVEIVDRSFDHLKVAARINEGYMVLGGFEFVNKYAPTLAEFLDLVVGNVNDKGLLSVLPLVDVLVQMLICFCLIPRFLLLLHLLFLRLTPLKSPRDLFPRLVLLMSI